MLPAIIIPKLIKKLIPVLLDLLMKTFPGLEKIDKLVNYMEKPNDADKEIEKIKSLILDKDLKIHELEMRVNNYEDQVLDLASKVDKIKK